MAATEFDRDLAEFRQFLGDLKKLPPDFSKYLREASVGVAKHVVEKSRLNAGTPQEQLVAKGLEARPDRIPKIRVSSSRTYVSRSRPNARRQARGKAKIIDVWFGTEFGGGKHGAGNPAPRKTYADGSTIGGGYTTQFRPHRGRQGYFFYPTVRQEGPAINDMYLDAVDKVTKRVFKEALGTVALRSVLGGR